MPGKGNLSYNNSLPNQFFNLKKTILMSTLSPGQFPTSLEDRTLLKRNKALSNQLDQSNEVNSKRDSSHQGNHNYTNIPLFQLSRNSISNPN